MADILDYTIFGDDLQLVEIQLDPDEGVRAEAGTMIYMEQGVEMETGTGGGILKGVERLFTGESFFITTFLNIADGVKRVAFAAPYPGKIVPSGLNQAMISSASTKTAPSLTQALNLSRYSLLL